MKALVSTRLGEVLKQKGISQTHFAKTIGATSSQVSNWCKNDETGKALSTPSIGYWLKIRTYFNISVDEVFESVTDDDIKDE